MKKALYYWCSTLAISFLFTASAHAWTRNFRCNATIQLTGTINKTFSPTSWNWGCNGIGCDREKACRNYIKDNWLNNGAIWGLFQGGFTPAEQNTICTRGASEVRVDYGFDERRKDWNFTQNITKTGCKCDWTCENGYWLEAHVNPAQCVRQACPANSMVNPGVQAWLPLGNSGYKTDDKGGTRFFKNATRGNCRF
jgi:hypothetical protein